MESINLRKRAYKKRKSWSSDAEILLITLWGDNIEQFRGCRKNSHIYREITESMMRSGFHFHQEEVRVKIHNIANKYRAEKRKMETYGESKSSWPFYQMVDTILGTYQSDSIELIKEEIIETEAPSTSKSWCDTFEGDSAEFLYESSDASLDAPPPKIKKKSNFQQELLKKIQESTEVIKKELDKHAETDAKMLKLQEDMVAIERERNEILKSLLRNNSIF